MAFLQPLTPYPNILAIAASNNKEWFMSPSLWNRQLVSSQIVNTGKCTDSIKYKCILFLQDVGLLHDEHPPCQECGQQYSPLMESTFKRKVNA